MPSPSGNEGHDAFIERCMADSEARNDFPNADQRLAFCESQWDRSTRQRNEGSSVERKAVPFECKVDKKERIVEGYASTFDRDKVDDIIQPGAFQKTIRERPGEVKVLWQHMEALGKPIHMEEDSTGLFTRSRISKTTLGDDALTLMEDGVVDRMSIGFTIPDGKARFQEDGWTREISEVKLIEYSPVTFAANDAAVISGVKELCEHARKHGRDAFGYRADELRDAIKQLSALLEADEPCGESRNTRSGQEPPARTSDPRDQLLAEAQSLSQMATALAVDAIRQR